MGDTLPPRGDSPDASPTPQPPAPGAYPPPPGAYTPPPTALAVVEPPQRDLAPTAPPTGGQRDPHEPDFKPPSPIWQAIKWPLRKALLGAYIAIQAARRHKVVTLIVSALLIALIATALIVRQLTLPGPPALAIEKPSLPAIPTSVIHYLHGQETYNAREMWDSLDATARTQSNSSESQLQSTLDQERAQGVQITRYIYSGGYQAPDGSSHYTIEVYATRAGQAGTFTWYFVVGSNGLITGVSSL